MELLLASLMSGVMIGLVMSLVALGLTIIFGVMDIVNFAHGEFLMLGMYAALLTAEAAHLDPLIALPAAGLIGFGLGVFCYKILIRHLLRGPMVAQLLGTFGLMLFLRHVALFFFGSQERVAHYGLLVDKSINFGHGVIASATKLTAALFSLAAFGLVWLLIHKTKIGSALRATAINAQGARYVGIPTEKMNTLAWGLGGATAALAGGLLVNFWYVNPYVGMNFTMIAFTIVALGGFGNVPGALLAGVVVGIITELPGIWDFFTYTFDFDWMLSVPMTSFKYTWVYLLYFLVTVLRPRGLLGWKH